MNLIHRNTAWRAHTIPARQHLLFGKFRLTRWLTWKNIWMAIGAASLLLLGCCTSSQTLPEPYDFEHGLVTSHVEQFSCNVSPLEQLGTRWSNREQQGIQLLAKPVSYAQVQEHSRKAHTKMLTEYIIVSDERSDSLQVIKQRLQRVVQGRFPSYTFEIFLVEPKSGKKLINAFCVGSHIYITTDLLELARDYPTTAFSVAHEMAHTINGHFHNHIRRFSLSQQYLGRPFGALGAELYQKLVPAFNVPQEIQCDMSAVYLMAKAGYPPELAVNFLESYHRGHRDQPFLKFFRTHPTGPKRITCLQGYINEAKVRAQSKH